MMVVVINSDELSEFETNSRKNKRLSIGVFVQWAKKRLVVGVLSRSFDGALS